MRFLVDESTGPAVARWLREEGHDVFSIFEEARGMDDDGVILKAVEEQRILITNDLDFGEKVYREGKAHRGVILLRLGDPRASNKIRALERLLDLHAGSLPGRFVVVTESRVRFASAQQPLGE